MQKSISLLLLTTIFSLQSHAQAPTQQQCKQLPEDIYLTLSYVYPCPSHESAFAHIENDFGNKVESVMVQCEQVFSKAQLQAWDKEAQESLQEKFNKVGQDIAQDQNAYCQAVKKDLRQMVQKYLPNQDFLD